MSWKQIQQAREIRLWIGQIVIPAIAIGAMIMQNPEAQKVVQGTVDKVKGKVRSWLD